MLNLPLKSDPQSYAVELDERQHDGLTTVITREDDAWIP